MLPLASCALLLLSGCEDDEENPYAKHGIVQQQPLQKLSDIQKAQNKQAEAGKDADLTPDQLHAKIVKQIKENQERAEKARQAAAKKQSKQSETKRSDDEDADSEATLGIYGGKTVQVLSPGDKNRKKNPTAPIKLDQKSRTTQNLAEIKGPIRPAERENDPVRLDNDGETKQFKLDKPAQKDNRGFFARLFGKKPAAPVLGTPTDGETSRVVSDVMNRKLKSDGSNFVPSSRERRDTVLTRVQSEMARRRLENEMGKGGDGPDSDDKKAETVDLDAPVSTPTPAPGHLQSEPADNEKAAVVERFEENLKPPGEDEIKEAADKQYREGLASRDVVAREASFQRAAMERREDAIPFLIEEIQIDNLLAAYAAQCLASIGKTTPEVESALLAALKNRETSVRHAATDAIARLRIRKAAPLIIELLKTDKSFPVRSAYCSALGFIGEREAIGPLKARLADTGEVEFVKSSAALALARLGDPTGRAHLIRTMDSPMPAMQVIGLHGMVQLNDPETAGYLSSALESREEEVWTTAVYLFPRLGPAVALPTLRMRLESPNEVVRRRAALAMGWLGSDDGLPYLDKACREGSREERVMGCELLGHLGRPDRVPVLVACLQDPHSTVRQTAAVALTRLNATEALPAMIEAARGPRANRDLPPALRSADTDVYERLVLLSCIRILRGEKDDLVISTLPNHTDRSWPEVDRVLAQQQVELVKLYQLVDVVSDGNLPVGAIIKLPNGKEVLFKEGETVAAGFRVRDIGLSQTGKAKEKLPAYVTLMRGDESVRLVEGHAPEVEKKRPK